MATSIKAAIQGLQTRDVSIAQGKVIGVSPLKIQITNDDKLVLSGSVLCVPQHLTDYTVCANISMDGGSVSGSTGYASVGDAGSHNHQFSSWSMSNGTLVVKSALKVNDVLLLLSFQNGTKYYVLDRVSNA